MWKKRKQTRLLSDQQKQEIITAAQARSRKLWPNGVQIPERLYTCRPDCPNCQGRGWYTEPVQFGTKQVACPNVPLRNRRNQTIWSDIKDIGNIQKAVQAIRTVLTLRSGFVYIYGQPGVGKTLCLKAAQNDPAAAGAILTDMAYILDDLRGSFDSEYGQTELRRRQEKWIGLPVLLIDEFDRYSDTGFAVDRFWQIINGRYERATADQHSVTVMASNKPVSAYDPAIQSRLEDGRFSIIEIKSVDLRPGKERN